MGLSMYTIEQQIRTMLLLSRNLGFTSVEKGGSVLRTRESMGAGWCCATLHLLSMRLCYIAKHNGSLKTQVWVRISTTQSRSLPTRRSLCWV